jgi:D-inositol-3-phosphate glycosyltransferase
MKIALVAQDASPFRPSADAELTGQDVRVRALAGTLARLDHRVTVYARKNAPQLPDRTELPGGVRVEYIAAGPAAKPGSEKLLSQVPAFSRGLAERWQHEAPDVVHAVRWTSGLAALAGARDLDVPVVQTFHSLGVAERRHQVVPDKAPAERIRLEPAIARSSNAVLATSSAEVSDLASLGVPRRSITVVPCGVDTDAFTPDGPAAKRTGRPRLLSVAKLTDRAALGTVLYALAAIPDAELVIVGGPPRKQLKADAAHRELAALATALGVSDRVTFTGRVDHSALPALFRSADLLVSMSPYAPFGMVSLEAMACGTPVVASAVGGHRDTVIDGATGLLVPPGRPSLLAHRIRRLLANPMLLEGYGLAAADRARSRYSWERIGQETVAAYDIAQHAEVA